MRSPLNWRGMLLTIETTHQPATDLGYLLHKHPAAVHASEHAYGAAHIFYPVATTERCQMALLLSVDPLRLVRQKGIGQQWALGQYVNDRPYAATSLLSTVLSKQLRSAMNGRSTARPELAATALPLTARLCAVASSGGARLLHDLFGPLGYSVEAQAHPLDAQFPEWGADRVFTLTLSAVRPLSELLTHLYVLVPVLDDTKHYWVGPDEIRKLLDHGRGWLDAHPQRELITRRYLKHQGGLTREALAQLSEESAPDPDAADEQQEQAEGALERPLNLQQARIAAVAAELAASGAQRVLDLGCGEGMLVAALLEQRQFSEIVGVDVSLAALKRAARRLQLDRLPPMQRERVTLLQGALTYSDERLRGYDAAALVEVIEHLDPPRLAALEASVFGHAAPGCVVVTTPNSEYNTHWASLPAGRFRHRDHRFEWSRAEFAQWAEGVSAHHGYRVRFAAIGAAEERHGAPTQMAVFQR